MGTGIEFILGGAAMGLASKPGNIPAPPKRSYLSEMMEALNAQGAIQPRLLGLEAQFTPQWQQQQRRAAMGQMNVLGDLFDYAAPLSSRIGNLQMSTMSPLYQRAGREMTSLYDSAMGPAAGLYDTMLSSAQNELALGRSLSPEETSMANQSARSSYAARGLTQGNAAIGAEILANNTLATQRENARRAFAADVYGMGANRVASAYNLYGQNLMAGINATSPAGMIGLADAGVSGLGPKLFQGESQMASDINSANIQNTMSTRLGNLQAQSGFSAGMMGMLGSMGGGYLQNSGLFGPQSTTNTTSQSKWGPFREGYRTGN